VVAVQVAQVVAPLHGDSHAVASALNR
jgi:hypothetical protein